MQDANRVPMAEIKRPWWYVTDQEALKKLIDEHSKVLVRVEVAVTGLQRRLSLIQTRFDSMEMLWQGVAQQNERLAGKQQRIIAAHDGLKGGLEAVTDRVVAIASGVDAVAGCVLELEGRLQRTKLDNKTEGLSTSSWMKELGYRFEELSALRSSYDFDAINEKLSLAKSDRSMDESSARTSTPPQPSVVTSIGECSCDDSPQSSAPSENQDAVTEPALEEQQSTSTRARQDADSQAAQLDLACGETNKRLRISQKAGHKLGRSVIRVMPPQKGTTTSQATEQRLQQDQEDRVRLHGARAPPRLTSPQAPNFLDLSDMA